MANVRDSDTSLWLHNKLGTSNDSWISGSICSQLNKEVLRNIKECFPDLQTQVKLKLLLSFFHIPRRLVEEWKSELEEVIEVAGLDSELWVSMLAETMKTFPATSSLNTEISDYEETRPIFTDMVNDLRKMVSKHSDLGMLPLECQYLNKNALVSVVGQQQNPVKHFTLKRKPKSANLRTELLHKSADAQSSLKKASAPTIPLRSRGMPRKMTDTTPLKGIPSRVPTSGFRSPNVQPNQSRPNMSRTPAGRKDGGIKLIEFTEQPLGYAAAKKRKRQQELEEQQKKALEQKQANNIASTTTLASGTATSTAVTATPAATPLVADSLNTETPTITTSSTPVITSAATPDYAPTLTYTQPPTPAVETVIEEKLITVKQIANAVSIPSSTLTSSVQTNNKQMFIKEEIQIKSEDVLSRPIKVEQEPLEQIVVRTPQKQAVITSSSNVIQSPLTQPIKMEKLDIKPIIKTIATTTPSLVQRPNPLANLPNNISVKITSTKSAKATQQHKQQQQQPILINSSTPVILSPPPQNKPPSQSNANQQTQTQTLKTLPLNQLKSAANSGPVIISQTIIQPAKRVNHNTQNTVASSAPSITSNISTMVQTSSGLTGNITNNLQQQQQQQQQQQLHQQPTQYIITSTPQTTMPSLASFAQARPTQQTIYQTSSAGTVTGSTQTPTKILLKTAPSLPVMMSSTRQNQTNVQSNPPPLISTQQPTILNIQNLPNRPVTIQPASHAAQQQHLLQQQQQQHHQIQQQIQTHTVVSNTNATQQPKLTQVVMQSPNNSNVKGKTIILTQKGVILRNIGGDMYQQIPISNMSGLQNLGGATIMTTGPPGLGKPSQNTQTIHVQQPMKQNTQQQMPALIPTNNLNQSIGLSSLSPVVVQQQQQPHQQTVQTIIGSPPQQTIIRPVMTQGSLPTLPQGLTLIQRHGQPTQLIQMQHQQPQQQQQQQQQIHRTILTQQPQGTTTNQLRPQQIILTHKPQQRIITTTNTQQALAQNSANNSNTNRGTQIMEVRQQSNQQQQQQQQPQRKGLSLSNEHVHKAHEMFRKANRVSRPDKALILGFMAGLRENPRPNSENVIVIKLGETEEKVQQEDGTSALCLVESLIRLDYNTGEWKTFQNYRRLDQNSSAQNTDGGMQAQNSVVI